ncbi:MAG: DUF2339 domain-containing protein [Burkholderiales bacterium]
MWIIGTVVGLLVGAMFGAWPEGLLWGALGGVIGLTIATRSALKAALAERAKDQQISARAWADITERAQALQLRVATLEQGVGAAAEVMPETVVTPLEPASVPAVVAEAPAESVVAEPAMQVLLDDEPAAPEPELATLPPPPPRKPPPPPRPPARPLRDRLPAPLAQLIFGGNMLVKLGVLILFLGLAFLLRYTAERVTVPIELRYAGVALAGAALLALGWLLRRKRSSYALILQGAGIGVFYLTTLAAMKLHALLPPSAGFGFLFAVAVLSALLAVLQNAPVLAIVAALEGFAAPVLASTGSNQPVALFSYLLVLDLGIFVVAWFRAWRLLNLIGLVGTFTLAAGWAQRWYTDDQYAIAQPYLIAFFLLFALIGLLFARRTLFDAPADANLSLAARAGATLKRVGRVDSSLVFGAPMAAFGLQYLLMRPWEFGAAFSALALGAFYLGLGRFVFSTQPRGLALLAEAYAIVGVIFATLAIPLALEGQWTGAAWAIEAAGMYWLGIRQQRPYARAFAFVLVIGAIVQLLRKVTVNDLVDGIATPLLHGSLIGPLLMAAGVFAIWALQRRARLDIGRNWEAIAGTALPWIGMGALMLLPWQTLTPMWAAAATALMALVAFGLAQRFGLAPLKGVAQAMQVLAVLAFIATLRPGAEGAAALAAGWQGTLAAALIALSVLASAAWSMREAHRAALATGVQPVWSIAQIAGTLGGVALLHLAMLFGVDLAQAAIIWPFTAAIVLWLALRLSHAPLAILAGVLHASAAVLFIVTIDAADAARAAFANLGFWTPLALGLSALVAADWLRSEARHAGLAPAVPAPQRWVNAWCRQPAVLWASLVWGLLWWLVATTGESTRVLALRELSIYAPAAIVGIVLITSIVASLIAARRDWSQLGQATLATLAGFIAAALIGVGIGVSDNRYDAIYQPAVALGWLAWPLALVWHLRLLRAQQRWLAPALLAPLHVVGLWFFMLLAARECQWQFARFGDTWASWPLLGWVLVPVLVLWALRSRALLQRWPLTEQRRAYLEFALAPVAACLLVWVWVTNLLCAGDAAPLPHVPLLNPLELAHALVLIALLLWWKALPESSPLRVPAPVARGIAAVTGWALLTGIVLRACHHYADVPWDVDALFASRLTQAALSITWAICGVLAMVLGHKRVSRAVWVGGAVLIGIVVVKLFLVELSDTGGLFRIVSFVGVGVLLLVVGYFAPVPPATPALREEQPA